MSIIIDPPKNNLIGFKGDILQFTISDGEGIPRMHLPIVNGNAVVFSNSSNRRVLPEIITFYGDYLLLTLVKHDKLVKTDKLKAIDEQVDLVYSVFPNQFIRWNEFILITNLIRDIITYPGNSFGLTTRENQKIGNDSTEMSTFYTYDHANRLLETRFSLNQTDPVLISQNVYNELGELIEKNLHSEDDETVTQSVDYQYNIRGWLSSINEPEEILFNGDLFGMNLFYDETDAISGASPHYNGNISYPRKVVLPWSRIVLFVYSVSLHGWPVRYVKILYANIFHRRNTLFVNALYAF